MMEKELFREFGVINKKGVLKIYNREQFVDRLKQLKATNVEIIVTERRGTFSEQQRRYYFSVIVKEIQNGLNYHGIEMTLEEVDKYLRDKFLCREEYNEETDSWERPERRFSKHITTVTKEEFNKFVDKVVRWAIIDLDWAVPYPNEIFHSKDFTESQILSLRK